MGLLPFRALNGMQKKFAANGTPIAPVRSRSSSRTASPKWAIRAASFTGSPFASSKPLPGLCEPSLACSASSNVSSQTLLWVVPFKMAGVH